MKPPPPLAVFSEAAPTLLTAAVVALGAQQVLSGQLQPGQLLTFFGYTSFLLLPMRAITELVVVNAFTRVSMRKVLRLLNIQPRVNDQANQAVTLNPLGTLHDEASGVTISGGKLTALVASAPEVSATLAMRLGRFDDADTVTLDGVDLRSLPLDQVRRTVVVSPPKLLPARSTRRCWVMTPPSPRRKTPWSWWPSRGTPIRG